MTGEIFLVLRIILTLLLYAFLFALIYFLWKDHSRQVGGGSNFKGQKLGITIESQGKAAVMMNIRSEQVVIGREASCECCLEDETVSARHATLKFHHGQWWLEDLGSTNGTYLNDQKVSSAAVLVQDDKIRCGKHTLTIRFE